LTQSAIIVEKMLNTDDKNESINGIVQYNARKLSGHNISHFAFNYQKI